MIYDDKPGRTSQRKNKVRDELNLESTRLSNEAFVYHCTSTML